VPEARLSCRRVRVARRVGGAKTDCRSASGLRQRLPKRVGTSTATTKALRDIESDYRSAPKRRQRLPKRSETSTSDYRSASGHRERLPKRSETSTSSAAEPSLRHGARLPRCPATPTRLPRCPATPTRLPRCPATSRSTTGALRKPAIGHFPLTQKATSEREAGGLRARRRGGGSQWTVDATEQPLPKSCRCRRVRWSRRLRGCRTPGCASTRRRP
jgi:hypothetical protein